MHIRFFLGGPGPPKPSHRVRSGETRFPQTPARGLRPPEPSRRRGRGETRLPQTPLRGLRPPEPSRRRGRGETRLPQTPLRGLRPPEPSCGLGGGCAGLRPASARGGGNLVSPTSLCEGLFVFDALLAACYNVYSILAKVGTPGCTRLVSVRPSRIAHTINPALPLSDRSYALASPRGCTDGLRPSANRSFPACGGHEAWRNPAIAPAAGGEQGHAGGWPSFTPPPRRSCQ